MGLLMGQYLDSRPLPGGHYLAGLSGCPWSTVQEVKTNHDEDLPLRKEALYPLNHSYGLVDLPFSAKAGRGVWDPTLSFREG